LILEAEERKRQRSLLPTNRTPSDPAAYAREVLGVTLWEKQVAICAAVAGKKRVTVRSCHHSGKTFVASALIHWWLRHYDPSLVLTTAPTARQVKDVLWHQIRLLGQKAALPGVPTMTELVYSGSQRALGLSTNEPERFQGWHCDNILVIVDEASGVAETIYEAIEGCLTGPNAHLLLIGNPNNASGTFYESFSSPLYEKFHISAYDVPESLLPAAWREERLQEWGAESPAYQVRVLGNFPDQGEDSLISLRWVTEAQERESEAGEPVEMGYDVAGYGGDESCVYLRRGAQVERLGAWRDADTMSSVGRVVDMARQHRPALIKVDSIGMGQPVYDRLREIDWLRANKIGVVGVNVGESASDSEQFANRRSEIFWGLRERFKAGEISLPADDDLLVGQLIALKFSYTSKGQIKLMSKDDMRKERSENSPWRSPDRADALSLCFARPTGFRAGARTGPARRAR